MRVNLEPLAIIYDWLSENRPWNASKISFATRRDPGIQAADIWARELMKRCDTHLLNDRARPRPQWLMLANTKRFRFHFTLGAELAERFNQIEAMDLNIFNHEEIREMAD